MQTITSRDNQYLKLARALQTKKGRRESGCFPVEGLRLAAEAAAHGDCAFALFSAEALAANAALGAFAAQQAEQGTPCFATTEALFCRACDTQHPQGVLVAARQPAEQRPAPGNGWYAYCDDIADPGNLGTIWRSAHAAGAAGLLLSAACTDAFHPKTVRASMGACFKLPVYRCAGTADAAALFAALGLAPLLAAADGADIRSCTALLARPHVWLLGSEAAGVNSFWRSHAAAQAVSLPMRPDAESLNVAAAAAVLFYQSRFARDAAEEITLF